ncbi:Hypothetical protein, putative [Bodo saltans]|uniref:Uncharacterized protein n=1 Tax=Bodo saltans TaxID=75058 RepID=A0A0S4IZX3_BODSA|nr:Hypothetical protein, putative [Bodo saltans]|eukprot:CUG29453.1 Hypothetical protein, putative [Bodo saltans]
MVSNVLKALGVIVGGMLLIAAFSQSTNTSITSLYELTTTQNVDHPFETENLIFDPKNVSSTPPHHHDQRREDSVEVPSTTTSASLNHHIIGGIPSALTIDPAAAGGDEAAATPAPEVVMAASDADKLTNDAKKNVHAARTTSKCDWRAMSRLPTLDPASGKWSYHNNNDSIIKPGGGGGNAHQQQPSLCDGNLMNVTFPITGAQLLRHFNGKKIVFMGDSVARNSFVLTMARMCNENHFDQCITRTPTMEFDVVNPPNNRGPMGCVPNETDMNIKSLCYEHGKFFNVPLRGLTLRSVPQDRNGRRNFIRKGLIGPVMGMSYGNVTLLYHPVTKPNQLTRTGLWMRQRPHSLLHADVIIVSIGPHLRLPEVQANLRQCDTSLSPCDEAEPTDTYRFVDAAATKLVAPRRCHYCFHRTSLETP